MPLVTLLDACCCATCTVGDIINFTLDVTVVMDGDTTRLDETTTLVEEAGLISFGEVAMMRKYPRLQLVVPLTVDLICHTLESSSSES